MTFATPILLAGTALVMLPIVLHLIMRRKPRYLEFPALRFIQKQHDTNRRRLRLRHLLLLALRVAAIGLLAFALARPSVKLSGSLGSQKAPVAAAVVFDTSKRMEYRHQNRTRLEVAQQMGRDLVAGLPPQSEVAVLDTRPAPGAFQIDRGAAEDRIERLATVANSRSLARTLDEALRLLDESQLPQREVYVFTDLARAAWPDDSASRLEDRIARVAGVGIYLIDVGIETPANTALGALELSGQVLSDRTPLNIRTELFHRGPVGERTVELHLLDAGGRPQKRSEQTERLADGQSQEINLSIGGLGLGTHQGYVRIVGQDGLACDDKRFFSVDVRPAWRILLVQPKPAERYPVFLAHALAPREFISTGRARFDCRIITLDELPTEALEPYSVVCLLDPEPLAPAVWQKLGDYAAEGHGVAIFLGRNATPVQSFNSPVAQELLPGKLVIQARRPRGDVYLAPDDFEHPILAEFRGLRGVIPWDESPVFRYWQLDELAKGTDVVVPLTDGRPAILERPLGAGRAITMTTPISDRNDREVWNLLPMGPWPFMALVNKMTSYLAGSSDRQLNYFAGQTAILKLDPAREYRSYVLTALDAPEAVDVRLTPDLGRHLLEVTATDSEGNYRVQAGGSRSGVAMGFSVNLSPEQTELERMTEEELEGIFGSAPYQVAQSSDQLEVKVSQGRVGRDLFGLAIVLVAVALGFEHVVSNRFYRK